MLVKPKIDLVVVCVLKVFKQGLSLVSFRKKCILVALELDRFGSEQGWNYSLRLKQIFFVGAASWNHHFLWVFDTAADGGEVDPRELLPKIRHLTHVLFLESLKKFCWRHGDYLFIVLFEMNFIATDNSGFSINGLIKIFQIIKIKPWYFSFELSSKWTLKLSAPFSRGFIVACYPDSDILGWDPPLL
jgi:hypothetical protein